MIFPGLATDPEWATDCLKWRSIVLTGVYSHWCFDWDGLPMDEYCEHEWPCACVRWLLVALKGQEAGTACEVCAEPVTSPYVRCTAHLQRSAPWTD